MNPAPAGFGAALRRRIPALGRRNYRIFITTQSLSYIGTWMQSLGQAWLIVVLTRDPFVLGMVTVVQGLPVLLFSLVGGVIADRSNKRLVLLGSVSVSGTLAMVLGVLCLTGTVEVWHVLVLAFLLGTVNAIEIPTRQAFVVEMVGPELLPSAVGLNSATFNGGRLVGPAVAGLLIGFTTLLVGSPVGGTGVAFLVNALSFVVVFSGLAAMRESELQPVARRASSRALADVVNEIGEGLRHARRNRAILIVLAVPGLIATLGVNFNVLIPVLALEYELDSGGLGFLMAANGVGSLVAALRVGMGGKADPAALVRGGLLLSISLAVAGIGAALNLPLLMIAALLFLAGAGTTSMRTAANTSLQLVTESQMRGRMMSLFALTFEGIAPLGAAITGVLAAQLGGPAAFVVCGAISLLLILTGRPELLRIRLDRAGRSVDEVGPVEPGSGESTGPPVRPA